VHPEFYHSSVQSLSFESTFREKKGFSVLGEFCWLFYGFKRYQMSAAPKRFNDHPQSRKKKRCPFVDARNKQKCRRKLAPVDEVFVCKCGATFCKQHRQPSKHNCDFDFSALHQEKLIRQTEEWQVERKKLRGNLVNKI